MTDPHLFTIRPEVGAILDITELMFEVRHALYTHDLEAGRRLFMAHQETREHTDLKSWQTSVWAQVPLDLAVELFHLVFTGSHELTEEEQFELIRAGYVLSRRTRENIFGFAPNYMVSFPNAVQHLSRVKEELESSPDPLAVK